MKTIMIILSSLLFWRLPCQAEEECAFTISLTSPRAEMLVLEPFVVDVSLTINTPVELKEIWEGWTYGEDGIHLYYKGPGGWVWHEIKPNINRDTVYIGKMHTYPVGSLIVLREMAFCQDNKPLFGDTGKYTLKAIYREKRSGDLFEMESPLMSVDVVNPIGRNAEALELWRMGFEEADYAMLDFAGADQQDSDARHVNMGEPVRAIPGAALFDQCANEYGDTIYGQYVMLLRARQKMKSMDIQNATPLLNTLMNTTPSFPLMDEVMYLLSRDAFRDDMKSFEEWRNLFVKLYPNSPWLRSVDREMALQSKK